MKTFPQLKQRLKKALPDKAYKAVRNLWAKVVVASVRRLEKFYLTLFFRTPIFKTITQADQSVTIKIDPKNGFVDQHIRMYGVYEPHIISFILRTLKDNGVFVDIGANIGQHSLFAASVATKGKVICFEPIARLAQQIEESRSINQFEHLTIHQVALGQENKTTSIHIDEINIGSSSVVAGGSGSAEIVIKVGDEVLHPEDKIDLMKVDVEGYEQEVFLGLRKTIERFKPDIIFEYSPHLYRRTGICDVIAPLELLSSLGYSFFDLDNGEFIGDYHKLAENMLAPAGSPEEHINIHAFWNHDNDE